MNGLGTCTLQQKPDIENDENAYNANYAGIFCFCKTRYDPDTEEGTMYQCIICEGSFAYPIDREAIAYIDANLRV